ITPIVEKAYRKGIRVIIVDRKTLSNNYTAFIGASNYEVGINAATFANSLLKGKGNVMEVSEDVPGSSAQMDRHTGFKDGIKQYPGLHFVKRIFITGDENPSSANVKAFLKSDSDIQFMFAQNDRIALSAFAVCKELGLDKKIKIIGVDGLPGKDQGIDLVEKKKIVATILYPTGGAEAILAAVNILENKAYQRENRLASTIIDSSNVRIMKLQNEKIISQQEDIDRRQQRITQQQIITNNQNKIIFIISISLGLALIMGAILYYYLQENKKINARLASQNEEILNQRNQLIELGKQARVASEAKINFFTNISHEFRTPLTLILGPLEELLENPKIHFTEKRHLGLIQKNVIRLLRLVNQLMDFRKIDSGKMKLSASENDLVAFAREVAEAFTETARNRNIDLRVISKEKSIMMWFDTSMLDKVLFNLISNSFKFTKDHGFIHITINKYNSEGYVTIRVEDNGIGMGQDFVKHAFELFYQANITNQQGSGLGLALSRDLIKMHKGDIQVESQEGKGTTFEIRLLLGTDHLENEEMVEARSHKEVMYYDQKIYSTEASKYPVDNNMTTNEGNHSEKSLLIIEDNPDLRRFIADIFSDEYDVIFCAEGISGLRMAYDHIPDIIIADIVLPGKDGFFICNTLKSDIRTSHIPIILLTAKTDIHQQIEGMRCMADAYLTKPFNVDYLKEIIKSLIRNREILKEHYTTEIHTDAQVHTPKKLDRRFISEFTSIVESHINDSSFSIDDLCKKMGVSRVQLYRKVKALLDCNVNDYILNVKIQKSKFLLSQEDLTVSEVAYKVGFTSPAYFSTVFKSKIGMTPTEYRSKIA
ncbi:MAG: substrate-binding domain-containing protein, partial [Bacteroidota bacterium]|nr:substrate-binding domain-containing protein [Bacteroidota bacterium]